MTQPAARPTDPSDPPADALTLYVCGAPRTTYALDSDEIATDRSLAPAGELVAATVDAGTPALAAWWAEHCAAIGGVLVAAAPDTIPAALVRELRALADQLERGYYPPPATRHAWRWQHAYGWTSLVSAEGLGARRAAYVQRGGVPLPPALAAEWDALADSPAARLERVRAGEWEPGGLVSVGIDGRLWRTAVILGEPLTMLVDDPEATTGTLAEDATRSPARAGDRIHFTLDAGPTGDPFYAAAVVARVVPADPRRPAWEVAG